MTSFSREKSSGRPKKSTWQKWLPVFALLFLLTFFGSIYWSSKDYSNEKIIADYFQSNTIDGKISDNIQSLENSISTDRKYLESNLLLAEYYIKNNKLTDAIEAYDVILNNQANQTYDIQNINFETVEWNKTLALLGNGERNEALKSLNKLLDESNSEELKDKAIELKKILNSFWYGWAN